MDPDGQPNGDYPSSGIRTPPLVEYMNLVATRNGGAPSRPPRTFASTELDSTITQLNLQTAYVVIDDLGHTWPGFALPGSMDRAGQT